MTRATLSSAGPGQNGPTGTATYEIRVAGHLDDHWAAALDNLTLVRLNDGTTSLTGPLIDQAQLHGLLARIRDLGVPLLTLRDLDLDLDLDLDYGDQDSRSPAATTSLQRSAETPDRGR